MNLPALLAAVRDVLAGAVGGPADGVASELLAATRTPLMTRPVAPSKSAARRHLVVTSPTALGPVGDLDWHYGYSTRADLARDVAFANIVGPNGPCVSRWVRIGLTLIGPDILYPEHRHPAVEMYVVLSGTASWSAGGEAFVERGPGSVILHPSGVPHAMRTGSEVLLALFGWTGAVGSPSVYTNEPPSPHPLPEGEGEVQQRDFFSLSLGKGPG